MTTNAMNLDQKKVDAGMEFAMAVLKQIPRDDTEALEAHMNAVLIVFWAALWGSFGTEYAQGFIEAQLRSMGPEKQSERFTESQVH